VAYHQSGQYQGRVKAITDGVYDRFGSDSERLAVSKTSPAYLRKRKSSWHLATSELGHKPTLARVCFRRQGPGFRTPCHQGGVFEKLRMRAMLSVRQRPNDLRQSPMTKSDELAAYRTFTRGEWAALRSNTPLTLSDNDLATLRGLNEPIALDEVVDIHLPLSRLLNLHVAAARNLGRVRDAFLGRPASSPPYIIALAGSPAVGKSTFARVLRALLARWPDHPEVELVATDGFLHPTRVLEERQLMRRKGFPESYDLRRMVRFLAALKAGQREVAAPVYSHHTYDIVPDEHQVVRQSDVLIFEGLNVLQAGHTSSTMISDFFDFSIYIDADEADLEVWHFERFLILQRTSFQEPTSYFHHYRDLPVPQAREVANGLWREINLVNLRENILPTRTRADVVLRKRSDHSVGEIWLRQT
jgi:type I pantothenate kinase